MATGIEVFKCHCTLVDRLAMQTHSIICDLVFFKGRPYLVPKWTDRKARDAKVMISIHADKLVRVDGPLYQYVYEFPLPIANIGPRILH